MNVSAAKLSCSGHAPNIDKDITVDQSGSTQAAGLMTERDAGKQTRPRRFELPSRQTCRGVSSGRRRAAKHGGKTGGGQAVLTTPLADLFKLTVGARQVEFVYAKTSLVDQGLSCCDGQ